MPFMSYQPSDKIAVKNAGKFITAGMDCIKVEGAMINRVKAIVDSGIIVMSHLGLTPHTRAKLGGYRVQGKTAKHADVILDQALRLIMPVVLSFFLRQCQLNLRELFQKD